MFLHGTSALKPAQPWRLLCADCPRSTPGEATSTGMRPSTEHVAYSHKGLFNDPKWHLASRHILPILTPDDLQAT